MLGNLSSRHCLLLICVTLVAVLLLQFEPLNDVDIYWQLKLGQMMLEQGGLVTTDSFTFTHAGSPVPPIGWLAQLVFAAVYEFGSWRAVQGIHVLLFAGAFAVAGASAATTVRDDRVGLFALGSALFLAWVAGASNSMVRPQSFAIFCFALLMIIAQSALRCRIKLAFAIPILLVWQNTHPSVAIGVLALAALAAAAWIARLVGSRRNGWRSANPLPALASPELQSGVKKNSPAPIGTNESHAIQLTLLALLAAAAQLATPMGWRIFETSLANLRVARDLLSVSEWLPPWDPSVRDAMSGFALSATLSIILLAKLRFRVRLADLALFVVMTLLALKAARFVIFWSVALVPVWAQWIELVTSGVYATRMTRGITGPGVQGTPDSALKLVDPRRGSPCRRAVSRAGIFVAVVIMTAAALIVPSAVNAGAGDQFALGDGIARLRQVLPAGRIYNYREWGGPLILAGHPHWQVMIDGRLYLYPQEEWQLYNDAALGRVSLERLVHRFQPDAFFLRPGFHGPLIATLRQSPNWREDYADSNCIIFVPAEPRAMP